MALFKIFKETALPGTLLANSMYVIAPVGTPNYVEIYVTNTAGVAKRIPTDADITAKINAALSAAAELTIVADITARNALLPTTAKYVYVTNATGDATVASGGATYLYNPANASWIKTSEAESLDVVLTWASIQGKPTSTPAQIDAAVAASHSHSNKTQLDLIGQSGTDLTYNGAIVTTQWNAGAVPGW